MKTPKQHQKVLLALLTMSMGAATAHDGPAIQRYAVYDFDAAKLAGAADWTSATAVRIEFDGRSYIDEHTRLKKGKPYRVELANIGDRAATLFAPELFRTSAIAKVETQAGSWSTPYFSELEVAPGARITFNMLPTETGDYAITVLSEGDEAREIAYRVEVFDSSKSSSKRLWKLRR